MSNKGKNGFDNDDNIPGENSGDSNENLQPENDGEGAIEEDKIKPHQGPEITGEVADKLIHTQTLLSGMYQSWFLDYASYVILERAVPHMHDGLKPVQRRILHSMKRMDDGRYNKVANIIGHTMQFHPHGDASIGDALVQLGQKDLLIDMQGNWGNIFTGDSAAAPRYIEARLSKFALDVVFNPKTTQWRLSYDGRNQEPVTLPVKFPLLLAQGVEGIAVGLASKILPHNFLELIDASVAHLKGESFNLMPDFPTGGYADCSRYNEGLRGGAIKVRAKISKLDNKTLVINDIPFGKTTSGLIESILKANEKGKIKIRKIDDNTAAVVEILVHLSPGISPDVTIDALYAFTDCEISISPNSCVIENDKPRFVSVNEILRLNTQRTLELLKRELEIRKEELLEEWHFTSLEKIFFEEKIYRELEKNTETWEQILEAIEKGFDPYRKLFKREITRKDVEKLTEKPVRKISKFDIKKADELIKGIEKNIDETDYHLTHIVPYTIAWYEEIRRKYGKGRERKTEIRNFDTIEATKVVVANEKLYVNKKEGFAGTGLKKDEYVCDCSDIDDIIVFRKDGKYLITKVTEKTFVGEDIEHIAVFKKNDTRTIYNVVYADGKYGPVYMKRFSVTGVTRDKEYDVSKGNPGSKLLYFSANPNGEAETIKVFLKPRPKMKKLVFELDFSRLAIKGRSSMGNMLTKYGIHKIVLKERGVSTLGGLKIWYDETVLRLNADGRGMYLGEFKDNEKILVVLKSGIYRLSSFELSNHYEDNIVLIEKYDVRKIFTAVYWDGELKQHYIKRFQFEETTRENDFIGEHPDSKLIVLNDDAFPRLELIFGGSYSKRPTEIVDAEQFIAVKGVKAKGKRLSTLEISTIIILEPTRFPEPVSMDENMGLDGLDDGSEDNAGDQENSGEILKSIDPDDSEQMKIF